MCVMTDKGVFFYFIRVSPKHLGQYWSIMVTDERTDTNVGLNENHLHVYLCLGPQHECWKIPDGTSWCRNRQRKCHAYDSQTGCPESVARSRSPLTVLKRPESTLQSKRWCCVWSMQMCYVTGLLWERTHPQRGTWFWAGCRDLEKYIHKRPLIF